MSTVFATFLLALSIQGAFTFSHDGPPPPPMDGPPMNGSWITRAGLFEGDIMLSAEQERQLNSTERQGILNTAQLWTKGADGKASIPYTFKSGAHSTSEKATIRKAMDTYEGVACFKFVERTTESDYIEIIKDDGCYSYVGRQGGKQPVSLGNGCVYEYIIVHELMHAMGFFHEQSRYDRDNYVTINWDNICCDAASNFKAQTTATTQLHNQPYDLKSIMHYGEYDFSTQNGVKKTIQAKDGTSPLGNSVGFTTIDIAKNNHLYQCGAVVTTTTTTTTTTPPPTACKDLNDWCPYWSQWYCTGVYQAWMTANCAKSCKIC